MSEVRLQGVDSIKFDADESGVSLGMGKDQRPFEMRYKLFFSTILPMAISIISLLIALIAPTFSEVFLLNSLLFALSWKSKRFKFISQSSSLFDKPKYLAYTKKAADIDFSPKEEDKKVKALMGKGAGFATYFLGHELNTNQELHAEDSKFRTHIIIFGTTGSGKTECILSICVNFLVQASGFILVDGKGDTLLFAKVFAICRAFDRLEDLYLLNFMDEGKKGDTKRFERISHKFNFFVDSSKAEADEIVGGLLPNEGGGGSGMWEGRAATGISSLNDALYYLKDNGYLEIDPDTYRSYFNIEEFAALAMNENIPKKYRAGLHTVLTSVNYKLPSAADPNPKQNPTTEEQFQYITMQYTETFNMLAGAYRSITVSQVPDISIVDVVLRRRILLVLLPSLAKAPQSVKNLGRIIIAMTRNVSSKAIGSKIEGSYKQVIESKPTAAISSFALIFDEFGTYATKGASTLPAQVRSLNMVCLFAGQDYQAFKRGDDLEAATIFANCTIKICLKLEDDADTFEKFKGSAGETYVMVAESFEAKDTMFGRKYVESKSTRLEKRPVLDIKDLKAQKAGWGTMIYGSDVYRFKAFYADPIMPEFCRLNHFLEIRRPTFPEVQAMRKGVNSFYRKFKKRFEGDWQVEEHQLKGALNHYSASFDELNSLCGQVSELAGTQQSETEQMVIAISAYIKKIELVDKKINAKLHDILGEEHDYDDDELLGDDGDSGNLFFGHRASEFQQVQMPAPQTPYQDEMDDEDVAVVERPQSRPKTKENVNDARQTTSPAPQVPTIDLSSIEASVKSKMAKLKQAENDSFDSLKAIKLDAFVLQERLQTLEEIMLEKQGFKGDSAKISQLTSQNLIVDMALRTNIAAVSEQERKKKNSATSSKAVKDVLSTIVKSV